MSTSEIKALLDEQGRVFEAFKAAFDEKHGRNAEEIDKLNGELDRLADRIDETRAAMRRSNRAEIEAEALASPERKAFASFLRKGKENVGPDELKVLLLSDDTAGGYLAPSEMVNEIIKSEAELSPMRTVARVRQTTARSLEIPRRSGQFSAVWTGEIETRSETEGLAWGLEEIPTHELTAEVYLSQQIREDASGDVDATFDVSSSCANTPAFWTTMSRLGAVLTDASANILPFSHDSGTGAFLWTTPILDVNTSALGDSAATSPLSVPPGLSVKAMINAAVSHGSTQTAVCLAPVGHCAATPTTTGAPLATLTTGASGLVHARELEVWTDASAQVDARASQSSTTLEVATLGWQERFKGGTASGGGGGGGRKLLKQVVASGVSQLDFVDGVDGVVFDGTYDFYEFEIVNLIPSSDDLEFRLRFSASGTFITTGYNGRAVSTDTNGASDTLSIGSGAYIPLTADGAPHGLRTAGNRYPRITITEPGNASVNTGVDGYGTTDGFRRVEFVGFDASTARVNDGVRFYIESGTFSGTFRLWGVRKS